MLAEGVRPSNEGRLCIPCRLIRKCLVIIHQHRVEFNFDTIFTLIQDSLGEAYPLPIEKDSEIRTQFHTEAKEFGRVNRWNGTN